MFTPSTSNTVWYNVITSSWWRYWASMEHQIDRVIRVAGRYWLSIYTHRQFIKGVVLYLIASLGCLHHQYPTLPGAATVCASNWMTSIFITSQHGVCIHRQYRIDFRQYLNQHIHLDKIYKKNIRNKQLTIYRKEYIMNMGYINVWLI